MKSFRKQYHSICIYLCLLHLETTRCLGPTWQTPDLMSAMAAVESATSTQFSSPEITKNPSARLPFSFVPAQPATPRHHDGINHHFHHWWSFRFLSFSRGTILEVGVCFSESLGRTEPLLPKAETYIMPCLPQCSSPPACWGCFPKQSISNLWE